MSMFDDPQVRREKKINRVARNGAYALGGGVGLWFMNALYPYEPGDENIAALFGNLAVVLIAYGVIVLATVMFQRKMAIPVNLLMTWLVLPAVVVFLFSRAWSG